LKNITEFKRLDIAKTNFMATLSHELKTPLSSINLSLKLILDERIGKLGTEQIQLIDNIRQETQRLLRYINELLDFSQIETGNIKLNITGTQPQEIINLSLEAMKPTFEQKQIQAQTNIEPNLPAINADIEKTVWVMNNLLSNAARFSPEGAILKIGINRNAGSVRFSVKDEGPGIDPRFHQKIFERFAQVYNNDNKGGTGLGLAIAKDFIEAQGGKIWVESALGEGSNFIFELPFA
jgi:NtrC-family two-component system sensor histidine kinase KinB